MPSSKTPLRAIDLFSGAGGLSQGFRDAGYEVPFALDFDEDSCLTYRANHPETHVEHASIIDFDPQRIVDIAGGKIDVVLGGPSCQSFSTAGRHSGWVSEDDERNDLWEHMFKVVEHIRPRAFLMENVPGMVYWGEGAFGDKILKRFESIGYAVRKEILLAADWGVPQRRRRLFIVGILGDLPFVFPEPTHLGGWRRDTLDLWEERRKERGLLEHISLADAISDLPPVDSQSGQRKYLTPVKEASQFARYVRRGSRAIRDHEVQELSAETNELISYIPAGGTWRDVPPHLLPDRYRGMRRTDSTNLLGRLDWALPSYTVTTQFNNVTTGCVTHPDENRTLSVREGARLQTFPDTYEFRGSLASRCRQIGNAVPPLLGHVLGYALAFQLDEELARVAHHPAPILRRSVSKNVDLAEIARKRAKAAVNQDGQAQVAVEEALAALDVTFELRSIESPNGRQGREIVLEQAKTVVLVKTCFLHACPLHSRETKSMNFWWAERIGLNRQRDLVSTYLWEKAGYTVAEYWEHENPFDSARHLSELADATIQVAAGAIAASAIDSVFVNEARP